jgi:hypothetical protein
MSSMLRETKSAKVHPLANVVGGIGAGMVLVDLVFIFVVPVPGRLFHDVLEFGGVALLLTYAILRRTLRARIGAVEPGQPGPRTGASSSLPGDTRTLR